MRKSVNGLKRPLAMALAAALMVTAVPADVAFAAPSEQEAVVQEAVPETVEEAAGESGEDVTAPVDAEDVQEETTPEDAADVTEETEAPAEEEPAAPEEEATEPETPAEEAPAEEEPAAPEEEVTEPETPAEEAPAEEEPAAPEEEATEPETPAEEAPAEEEPAVPVEEAVATEEVVVTEEEAVDAQMSAEKPATPVLSINERNGQLRWTPVPGAKKYEISVADGVYSYYTSIEVKKDEQGVETVELGYIEVSNDSNKDQMTCYTDEIGWDVRAKDPNKNEFVYNNDTGRWVYANAPGATYTYSVRAVNQELVKKVDPVTNKEEEVLGEFKYGDWSNSVSYAAPSTVVQITDLAYAGYDKELRGNGQGAYVLSFSANITSGGVIAEISKDATFANANPGDSISDYVWLDMADNKYYLSESLLKEYAGTPVFVRVYNRDGDNYLKDIAGKKVYSNVVRIDVPAKEQITAPAITGLKIDREDAAGYVFTFDANLDTDKEERFELQWSKDVNFPKEGENVYEYKTYSQRSDNIRINYDAMDADVNYYVRAVSKVYVDGHYDANNQWVDGDWLYGTPSNVLTIMRKSAVSTISKLALKETTQTSFVLGYSGTIAENEDIEVQVSSKSNFPADIDTALVNGRVLSNAKTYTLSSVNDGDTAKKVIVNFDQLDKPGTYYVRARVIKKYPSADDKEDTMEDYAFSSYTNTVKVKVQVADMTLSAKDVTSKSVTLVANGDRLHPGISDERTGGAFSGYEFQKKVGKSWVKLARITDDNYVDSGLDKDVKYSYRARAFWRNNITGKTYNGEWSYFSITTWGATLSLDAQSASTTSIKLAWNKISGAEGYEVYRMEGCSPSSKYENRKTAEEENIYHKYQLIKTVSSKTTSYTDKKLTKNEEYYYYVRAYKTVDGKKSYIQSNEDGVVLKFGSNIVITSEEQATNGKVTVTWKKVASAKGYLVEKQDPKTGKYKTYKKIKKNTTTKITLPAVKDPEQPEIYRIRAYKSSKNGSTSVTEYSGSAGVTVNVYLKAPSSVKAVAQKDGSVKVTWKKVKGADYYVVYRTTSSSYTYNKSNKKYDYTNGTAINVYKEDAASVTGYSLVKAEDVTGSSVVDRSIKKLNARNEEIEQNRTAPKPGYTYYYYVVAVKKGAAEQYVDTEATYSSADSKAVKVTLSNTNIATPKSVKVKAAKGKVTVSWKADKSVEGYEILRSTKKNGTYEVVGTVTKATTKKYVDKTAKAGKTYYYTVRAVKANEAGADSHSAESTPTKVKAK